MGYRIVRMSRELFEQMFVEGYTLPTPEGERLRVTKGLPAGARLVAVAMDLTLWKTVVIQFEHPSWPETPDFSHIREATVEFTMEPIPAPPTTPSDEDILAGPVRYDPEYHAALRRAYDSVGTILYDKSLTDEQLAEVAEEFKRKMQQAKCTDGAWPVHPFYPAGTLVWNDNKTPMTDEQIAAFRAELKRAKPGKVVTLPARPGIMYAPGYLALMEPPTSLTREQIDAMTVAQADAMLTEHYAKTTEHYAKTTGVPMKWEPIDVTAWTYGTVGATVEAQNAAVAAGLLDVIEAARGKAFTSVGVTALPMPEDVRDAIASVASIPPPLIKKYIPPAQSRVPMACTRDWSGQPHGTMCACKGTGVIFAVPDAPKPEDPDAPHIVGE